MLQSMRELAKSWIFKSLMGLLVISFGIWGIGDMFRGNPAQRTVGEVGKVKIPVQSLEMRFQMDMPEARRIFGPEMSVTQARQMGILDRTLHMMMEEASFDQEADRLGINVSRDAILKKLANEPRFRGKDGKFNAEVWHRALSQMGLTEQSFFDTDSRNTARQIVFQSIIANRGIPKTMIDTLYQARGAKRIAEVLILSNDSMKGFPPATDEELQTYYKEHENEFVAPEVRGFTVAKLSTESMSKDVTVSDAEIEQAYKDRSAEMTEPETRDMVQIVVQDEAKAKAVYDAAQKNRNLTEAAKANSLTAVALNKVDEKAILPELYTTVFALEENSISAPTKSSLGWHVIQMKKIHDGGTLPLDRVKERLRKSLQDERVGDLVAKTVNQIDDGLAGGLGLDELADTYKLHLDRFASLDAQGRKQDGKPEESIPAKDLVLQAAFAGSAGETGQVLDDGKGNYYIVRVDTVTPSQVRPFEEAKPAIVQKWTEQKLYEKANAEAEVMAKELREGKTATSYASRPGIELRLSKAISLLGDTDKDLPAEAIPLILSMKKGDVTIAASKGKQYVLRLLDIAAVNPDKPEATRTKVVDDLKEKLPHNLVEQYSNDLHKTFPQSINKPLLENLKNQSAEVAQ